MEKRTYEYGMFWISQTDKIKEYVRDENKLSEVLDILSETESDLMVEGENKFLEAYRKLQAIDEEEVANKFIKDLI